MHLQALRANGRGLGTASEQVTIGGTESSPCCPHAWFCLSFRSPSKGPQGGPWAVMAGGWGWGRPWLSGLAHSATAVLRLRVAAQRGQLHPEAELPRPRLLHHAHLPWKDR